MDPRETAILTLGLYYSLYGHTRRPIPERLRDDGWAIYHKGWEARFRLPEHEVSLVRTLIAHAGYRPANPYRKGKRLIQSVHGRQAVEEIRAAAGQRLTRPPR